MNDLMTALIAQGRTKEEAQEEFDYLRDELYEYIDAGDTVSAAEVLYSVGLEPDYLMDLI